MRISFSSFETYQNCPLKYKFQNIDKIKEPKSKEAIFGSILHSVMKFVHTPGILSPSLDQAMEFFSNLWNATIFENPDEERAAFSQGVRMIQDYYKKNNPAKFNIVDLESRFQIEIGKEGEKHIVSGIIDRIDKTENGFEIIDYKTTKKMPAQEKVDNNMQLSVYLQAFLSRYPSERKNLSNLKVSLYFLKHGVKLSAQRTEEQLQKTEGKFLEAIRLIKEEHFEPQISPLCDWCGYQNICPMWKHKFKNALKIDTEEINRSIQEYIDLKSAITITRNRLGKLQQKIFQYMEQEGADRVFGENGIIAKSKRKTYGYDKEKIKALLEPLGFWEEITKIDGIALRGILEVLPFEVRKSLEEAKTLEKETETIIVKKG